MNLTAKEFKQWSDGTIADVDIKDLSAIKSILSASAKSMRAKTLAQVHDAITLLAQYGMFIQNQLNAARAAYKYYEAQYRNRLAKVLTVHPIEARSKDEREILAIQIDAKLKKLDDRTKEFKLKVERLDGLPYSITTYYHVLIEIYKLKIYERKYVEE